MAFLAFLHLFVHVAMQGQSNERADEPETNHHGRRGGVSEYGTGNGIDDFFDEQNMPHKRDDYGRRQDSACVAEQRTKPSPWQIRHQDGDWNEDGDCTRDTP